MNEDILSFIWRFQYFDSSDLQTADGQIISVTHPGIRNSDSGPDFSNARIQIDGVSWAGAIEIHVNASDWDRHGHKNYESVILHVVWNDDKVLFRNDGTTIPTLALNGKVRHSILKRYALLQNSVDSIPCGNQFAEVNDILKFSMLDRVILERLNKKADLVLNLLDQNQNDWEETAYQWIGQHFGFKLNDPPFLHLCQITSWKTVRKLHTNRLQLEALLFGNAGLISDSEDDEYIATLRNEYAYLCQKYNIQTTMNAHEWKFLRLRPPGFPTVRLSQFAHFLQKTQNIFSDIVAKRGLSSYREMFSLKQSAYWTRHVMFGKKTKSVVPFMGESSQNTLIINAIISLLVAHSKWKQEGQFPQYALDLLATIPAENNKIIRLWENLNIECKTAADSQGLIEWHNQYCVQKRCLDCTVGLNILAEKTK